MKIRIDDELRSGYSYIFPVEIYSERNSSKLIEFNAEENFKSYSLSEIENYISQAKDADQKTYSTNLSVVCSSEEYFYEYDHAKVYCTIENKGNMLLEDIEICLDDECDRFDLGIGKNRNIEIPYKSEAGFHEKNVFLKGDAISKSGSVNITLYDEPDIGIENLSYPSSLSYGENSSIKFTLSKESFSNPQDVIVKLKLGSTEKIWNIEEMAVDKNYIVNIDSSDLSRDNVFHLSADFRDKNDRSYSVSRNFNIMLEKLSLKDASSVFFKDVLRFIEDHYILSTFVIAVITFLVVLSILLGKGKDDF